MGVQSEILNGYRSLQNANNVPKFVNANNARVDNMSFVDFIFEMLKMTKGRSGFDGIVMKGVLTDLKNSVNMEDEIKKIINEFLMCNIPLAITKEMTTLGTGFDILLPELDPFNLLSVDPNGKMGKYYYEGNNKEKDINYNYYKGLSATKANPIQFKKNDIVLFSLYSVDQNTINFSFGEAYTEKYFSEWVSDYLTDIKFFNIPNFGSMLIDLISGVVSVSANKKEYQIAKEAKLIAMLKKIFGYCSDDDGNKDSGKNTLPNSDSNFDVSGDDYLKDYDKNGAGSDVENQFDFSGDELYDIDDTANRLANNLLRFNVCSPILIPMDPTQLIAGLDSIFDAANTGVTNDEGAETYDNNEADISVDALQKLLDGILSDSVNNAAEANDEPDLSINLPNIKLEFQLDILKQIPYAIMKTIITPKLFGIFKIGGIMLENLKANFNSTMSKQPEIGDNKIIIVPDDAIKFKAGDTIAMMDSTSTKKDMYVIADIEDSTLYLNRPLSRLYLQKDTLVVNTKYSKISLSSEDILTKLKGVLKNIGSVITDKILKNIYNMIKDELTKLALELLKKALLQRLKDYVLVLESLIALLKALGNLFKKEKCSSMLAKILALLKLNVPIPAIPMPPFLTMVAGAFKPGMNEVVAINQMKTELEKYGINTSEVNADGSPNAYILGLQAVMSTTISHIKSSANIQVETISAVGPTKGFAQIQ